MEYKDYYAILGVPKTASQAEIKKAQGIQMGIGMSQEIDSNMAGRALLWSFGGSIQDANEKVVINSPETVAAVEEEYTHEPADAPLPDDLLRLFEGR